MRGKTRQCIPLTLHDAAASPSTTAQARGFVDSFLLERFEEQIRRRSTADSTAKPDA